VVLSGLLLVLVFIEPFRAARNGAFRWVEFPLGAHLTFQPSELARIVMVLWVADRCVKLGPRVHDVRRGVLPMLCVALFFFVLVLVETDLGGSMLLLICALSTMWVGGARMLPVRRSLVAIGGGVISAASLFVPYMRNRISMWFGPGRQRPGLGHAAGAGLGRSVRRGLHARRLPQRRRAVPRIRLRLRPGGRGAGRVRHLAGAGLLARVPVVLAALRCCPCASATRRWPPSASCSPSRCKRWCTCRSSPASRRPKE
jgi:hypothetical protein